MNVFILYLLLLKAVCTSFSGMASLPIVRNDFVVSRHLLTDRQLNTAVVTGRTGPGPNGLYVVSVGYFVDGLPGAMAGLLALVTPAFLIIPMMRWVGDYAKIPRVRSAIRAVVLASAGLLIASSIPLAQDAATGPMAVAIIVVSFVVLTFTNLESWWVMMAAAVLGVGVKLIA
jgi:chromate transporter